MTTALAAHNVPPTGGSGPIPLTWAACPDPRLPAPPQPRRLAQAPSWRRRRSRRSRDLRGDAGLAGCAREISTPPAGCHHARRSIRPGRCRRRCCRRPHRCAGPDPLIGDTSVPVVVVADPRASWGSCPRGSITSPPATCWSSASPDQRQDDHDLPARRGLAAAGDTTGIIGTIGIRVGDRALPSARTTPKLLTSTPPWPSWWNRESARSSWR